MPVRSHFAISSKKGDGNVRVVVDASFAGAWLLPDEASARAEKTLKRVLVEDALLCVPRLWIYELANLLISAERRKRITREQLVQGHQLIDQIPRTTFDHEPLLARERMSTIAERYKLSAYDAAYLELADRLQCALLTLDKKLRVAAKAVGLPD